MRLAIKLNNDGQAGHFCALCAEPYRASDGPELFVDGEAGGVVCPSCGRRVAPWLAEVLAAWHLFEDFRRVWRPTPAEQAFRRQWGAEHADVWDEAP